VEKSAIRKQDNKFKALNLPSSKSSLKNGTYKLRRTKSKVNAITSEISRLPLPNECHMSCLADLIIRVRKILLNKRLINITDLTVATSEPFTINE
jgi:hypothetical protein